MNSYSFFAALGCVVLALGGATMCRAQQVYVGTSNGRDAMMAHPEQWEYVRQNADGFYVNFIQMLKMDKEKCAKMAALMTHKNAFFESDSRYKGLGGFPDGGQFSRALQTEELNRLLGGGFNVTYASLNYGVDADKRADLQTVGMTNGKKRPIFAQFGPWNLGGDLARDKGRDNAKVRDQILQNDGGVTDGPIGFWTTDVKGMRGGSISSVKFCRANKKLSAVMVCPYGAGVKTYDFGQWLTQMQKCVRDHEDAGAKPDLWSVFEYATIIPALPESVNGKPANTTMGAAFWLLHHLRDPDKNAQVVPVKGGAIMQSATRRVVTVTVQNTSDWLDLCPVLSARLSDADARNWTVRYTVDGKAVSARENDLAFARDLRLWPGTSRTVQLILEPRQKGSRPPTPAALRVALNPNPSNRETITQWLVFRFNASDSIVTALAQRGINAAP